MSLWNRFTRQEAARIARVMRLDLRRLGITLDAFHRGLNVELEHRDVTGGDPILTAKIALAHLRERPDYYERLLVVERG